VEIRGRFGTFIYSIQTQQTGLFLCCTGIGIVGGVIMVAIYFYQDYTQKQDRYHKKEYATQTLSEAK